ncbi:MAG: hypothetical protein ACRDNL_08245, partial [Spirillospora sp.]
MFSTPPEPPPPPARVNDPLAVAVGNASLLGIGYLMMGRRRTAIGTGLVTIVLVSLVISTAQW